MSRRRLLLASVVVASAAGAAALAGLVGGPAPAGAAVEHGTGFRGVVDGFRSWYGSYRLGEHGEVWCVDHGIPAPDVVHGYEPTGLEDRAPETRRAVAWAVGRHGIGADRVTAAALMLALHDLMGAVYPSGPLSVDTLGAERLHGFEGHEEEVVAQARRIKADAVGRAHLVSPLVLSADAPVVPAGSGGELRARLSDVTGAPLEGVVVEPRVTGAELLGAVDRPTDAEGRAAWPFVAAPGRNTFELTASVPGAELLALRPSDGLAQRVVRPATAEVHASTAFEGLVPRRLTIHKRGDAEPRLPVAGARFDVDGREVVVGADGRTPPLELLPGSYVVTEVAPPPGYATAGPWTVTVADVDVVLEVLDHAIPGHLQIDKVDARTGAPVPGARFSLRGDLDADPTTFEVEVTDPSAPLVPARYEVREVEAPPHHRIDVAPRIVDIRPGERTVLRWPNVALATVAFEKRPPLPGAVFVVRVGEGDQAREAGRCTTGGDGRCALPDDAVEAAAPFCWEEVVAPPGWALDPGGCATAGATGSTTLVAVDERPLPVAPSPTAPPATPSTSPLPPAASPIRPASAPVAPSPPATPPAPPPARVVELPRTGRSSSRLAGIGLALLGVGSLLVVSRRSPAVRRGR